MYTKYLPVSYATTSLFLSFIETHLNTHLYIKIFNSHRSPYKKFKI